MGRLGGLKDGLLLSLVVFFKKSLFFVSYLRVRFEHQRMRASLPGLIKAAVQKTSQATQTSGPLNEMLMWHVDAG